MNEERARVKCTLKGDEQIIKIELPDDVRNVSLSLAARSRVLKEGITVAVNQEKTCFVLEADVRRLKAWLEVAPKGSPKPESTNDIIRAILGAQYMGDKELLQQLGKAFKKGRIPRGYYFPFEVLPRLPRMLVANTMHLDGSRFGLGEMVFILYCFGAIKEGSELCLESLPEECQDNERTPVALLEATKEALAARPTRLEMTSFRITGSDLHDLVHGIANLANLEVLNLSYNFLTDVSAVQEYFPYIPGLQELRLGHNRLTNTDMKYLASGMAKSSNLRILSLDWNALGDDGALAIASMLMVHTGLEVLELQHNNISASGVAGMAQALMHPKLQQLNLAFNSIGDGGVASLAERFTSIGKLHSLNLSANSITDEGVKLVTANIGALKQLHHLYISLNTVRGKGASAMASSITQLQQLQVLEMRNNKVANVGVQELSQSFMMLPNLQALMLRKVDKGVRGAAGLAQSFRALPHLEELHLGDNGIKDEGAVALSEHINWLQRLKKLSVEENNFGYDGSMALAEGLHSIRTLQELNMSGNRMYPDAATALASSIRLHQDLRVLRLGESTRFPDAMEFDEHGEVVTTVGCNIGDEGAVSLTSALLNCSKLQRLELAYETINERGKAAVRALKARLPNLTDCEIPVRNEAMRYY